MNKRDKLKEICKERQGGLCVVCGHGIYESGHLHEAIVKRGDLPGDNRIFIPENCCVLHEHCHENTKRVDDICIGWLVETYGHAVMDFVNSLHTKTNTGRMMNGRQQFKSGRSD